MTSIGSHKHWNTSRNASGYVAFCGKLLLKLVAEEFEVPVHDAGQAAVDPYFGDLLDMTFISTTALGQGRSRLFLVIYPM